MSKYKAGDKFIVEVKEVMESEKGTLYRADFNTLTFDDYGLDKLPKYCEVPTKDEFIEPKCTFEKEVEEAYNKGLNDAWELVRKICNDMDREELIEVFGNYPLEFIQIDLTPQEALAKLKAYEEQSKIEVGDVVVYAMEKCVVLDLKGDKVVVLTSDGCVLEWHKCDVEKTGKHINLDGILEQISEV